MTILISLGFTFALMGVFQWLLDYRLEGVMIVVLYLVIYAVVHRIRKVASPAEFADEPDPDYSHLPTSGPIGRFGQKGLLVPWLATNALSLLNPFQLAQIVRQISGNSGLEARERDTGDDGRGYRT